MEVADQDARIVAFDFDGTLTTRDSFTSFLAWRAGRARYALGMIKLAPALVRYLGDRDRGRIKAAAVSEFLAGTPRADLERDAEAFAAAHAEALVRPDALATWAAWRERGARLVIVTASPALTVAPFARRLGAHDLLGTELAFDAQGRVSGAFTGENCRGAEKVRRLRRAFGQDVRLAAAYGDTGGDTEMLAIAEQPGFRVFTGRP